jgi:hypothetical protein
MSPPRPAEHIWRALMRVIQRDNACKETGRECREPFRCGCHIEALTEVADAERARTLEGDTA